MKIFLMLLSMVAITLTGCVHERVIYQDRVLNPSDEIATQEPPEMIQPKNRSYPTPLA